MKILWSTRQWAEAVVALDAPGPLPRRTVLTPRQRVVHSLRREIIRLGSSNALAGTRFLSPLEAAEEVLRAADVRFVRGEEGLRAARLLALLRGGLSAPGFPPDLVSGRPGWDDAIARTIADLEAAGLRPDDLERGATPRAESVARFWRRLDVAAGPSWTRGRILTEAAAVLESGGRWPLFGQALAAVCSDIDAAEARFLLAIPKVQVAILGARPIRGQYVARLERLLGARARSAIESSSPPRVGDRERDALAGYLFEPPLLLADEGRPGPGPDGSVELEEYAGVDAELEAAANWVSDRILEGVPLECIGVLLPSLDPLGELVAARLGRLPWPGGGALPLHVAGGLPLRTTASGARTLAILRGLEEHLAAESVAQVLPVLRLEGSDRHLSLGAAAELVGTLGAVGGDPSNPAGALGWADAAFEREQDLSELIFEAGEKGDSDPATRRHQRLLADLTVVRPAIDALVAVARLIGEQATLATLWEALRGFLDLWVLHPGEGPRAHHRIDEEIAPLLTDSSVARLDGADALRLIIRAAESARVDTVRFGEPAVYVGSIREAVGLRFTAVRVLGLCEGHFPSATREDPVLPDLLKGELQGAPATATDRILADLHALDRVVRDTERTIVLSAPRTDLDSSQREASSVLLEAAGALGRDRESVVPDLDGLRRDYFEPARRRLLGRAPAPLSEAGWEDAVAEGAIGPPPAWAEDALLSPGPIPLPDEVPEPGPWAGLLWAADLKVPGLDAAEPLSPSALHTLLECPYRFLLERVLRFSEPASPRSRREIDSLAYGTLLHEVAESLYRDYGERIAAGEGKLSDWRTRARTLADEAFESFVRRYPLAGPAVRRQERERLRRDLFRLIGFDWKRAGKWRLIGVERTFGFDGAVTLPAGSRSIHVRGRIDRVEVEGDTTVVRDLKTGKRKDEKEPTATIDAQIGVYAMVAARLAREWGAPSKIVSSYTYVGGQGVSERRFFGEDAERLGTALGEWLSVAAQLLERRAFPRTPNDGDCEYCPYEIACGEGRNERATKLLEIESELQAFRSLKATQGGKKRR